MKKALPTTRPGFLPSILTFVLLLLFHAICFAQNYTYGNGSLGAVTISTSESLAGGTYQYTNLTINSGVTVTVTGTAPLIIECTGTFTLNGTIKAVGGNGGNGSNTAAGAAGVAVAGGKAGGIGGLNITGAGASGSAYGTAAGGAAGVNFYVSSGGGGGGGYSTAGTAGEAYEVAGGVAGGAYGNSTLSVNLTGSVLSSTVYLVGGSGGGGGGGNGDGGSTTDEIGAGGGGAGGGAIQVTANTIIIGATGSITVAGGNGGAGGTNTHANGAYGGGGGAGSGGTINLQYFGYSNSGSNNLIVSGGTGGNGDGTTYAVGGAGAAGYLYLQQDYCTSAPSGQPGNVTLGTSTSTSQVLSWAGDGGGTGGVVVFLESGATPPNPVYGNTYTPNSVFGSGTEIVESGAYAVYNSSTNTGDVVTVTNLIPSTTYHYSVVTYNTAGPCYLASTDTGSFTTADCSPATDASIFSATSNAAGTQLTINYTRGSGNDILVVARAGSAVTTTGQSIYNQDFSSIPNISSGSYAYGTAAAEIGTTGNYVVYQGTASSFVVTGLSATTAYSFAFFEYNTSPDCYSITPLTAFPMQYTSNASTAESHNVFQSEGQQDVISVAITVGGTTNASNLSSITFTTTGTTSAADIVNAQVFYSGTSNAFSTATQFGSTYASPNGTFTITGNQALSTGTNYFWLTYNVSPTATAAHVLHGALSSFILGSNVYTNLSANATSPATGVLTVEASTNANDIYGLPIMYYDFESDANRNTTYELSPEFSINTVNNASVVGGTFSAVGGATSYWGGTNGAGMAIQASSASATGTTSTPSSYILIPINTTGFTGESFFVNLMCSTGTDFGINYSTNGGSSWTKLTNAALTTGVWEAFTTNVALPSTCDNNANVELEFYGYSSSSIAVDNFTLYALNTYATTLPSTKTITLPDYTLQVDGDYGIPVGSDYYFTYDYFNVTGSGTTVILNSPTTSTLAMSVGITLQSGATFTFGTAAAPTYLIGTGGFTMATSGATTLNITNVNGISTTGVTSGGNIQSSGVATFDPTATYNYMASGTTNITGTGLPSTLSGNLSFNSPSGNTALTNSETVSGTVTLTNGTVTLGSNNLTINGTLSGSSYSASNMFILNGSLTGGQLALNVPATATNVVFPVGTGSQYNPATLDFATNSTARSIGVRLINSTEPNNTAADYINMYWHFTDSQTGNGTYSYSGTLNFNGATVTGNSQFLKLNVWNGSNWLQDNGSSVSSDILYSSNGLTNSTFPIGGNDFTVGSNLGEVACTPPTEQVSEVGATKETPSTELLSWTVGNGSNTIVVINASQTVNYDPVGYTPYSEGGYVFGSGSELGTGNYVVYNETGNSVTISNLLPDQTYYYAVYSFAGATNCYMTPGVKGSFTTQSCSPGTDATNYVNTPPAVGTTLNIQFTRGSGSGVLVVAHQGANIAQGPSYGTDYSSVANSVFGTASAEIGTSGDYVLYDETGNGTNASYTLQVTGLTPQTTYYFAIYEYNITGAGKCYSTTPLEGNSTTLNPMIYSSSTTTQNTTSVAPGATKQEIVGLQIVTTGATDPAATLNSITFNTTGTTNSANDIANVYVYYTGTSGTFSAAGQFGSTVTGSNIPSGASTYTVNGTQTLAVGTNYFWIAYDVPAFPTSTSGDYADAAVTSFNITSELGGTANETPSSTASGNREILLAYCTPGDTYAPHYACSGSGLTYNAYGTANVTVSGLPTTTLYNDASCVDALVLTGTSSANVVQGLSYTLSVTRVAGANYSSYLYAYVDWNNDGSFTDAGDLIASGTNSLSTSFTVPSGASIGNHAMWILNSFGSTSSPCSVTQGQFVQCTLNVEAAGPMAYASSSIIQNSAIVSPNTTSQEVVELQVVTTGETSPLSLTSLSANTTGSTNIADLSNARLYYTGTSSTFATTTQIGSTIASPSGAMNFTGSATLNSGTNYFWLAYDIPSTATPGDLVTATINSITVAGNSYTPTLATSGAREVMVGGSVPIIYYDFEENSDRDDAVATPEQDVNNASSSWEVSGTTGYLDDGAGAATYHGGTAGEGSSIIDEGFTTSTTDPQTAATYYTQVSLNTTGFVGTSISFDALAAGSTEYYPYYGVLASYNGGSTWNWLVTYTNAYDTWYTNTIALPSAADNNANLEIRIYGFYGTTSPASSSTLDIDNFYVYAAGTTTSAGTKTLPNFVDIYDGETSGGGTPGIFYEYDNFTVAGSGTTVNLATSNIALSGSMNVANSGTLIFGTAVSPTAVLGTGVFNLYQTGAIGITDENGIEATGGVYGNVQITGTRTYSAGGVYDYIGPVQYSGNGLPASITGTLTVNNGSSADGVILSQVTSVSGTLNLTSGVLSSDENPPLTLSSTGTVNRTSGWVYGPYQKYIAAGSNVAETFEVGSDVYAPVNLTFSTVSSAGNLTISTNNTNDANIASSNINASETALRYWVLQNPTLVYNNYNAVFNFDPTDVTAGGGNPSNFIGGLYNTTSDTWSYPTVGTLTSTSTQLTGITGVGEVQLGDPGCLTNNWVGGAIGAPTDWFTAANWSCGTVPSSTTNVLIPSLVENYPVISGIIDGPNATVNNLTIQSGANIDIQGTNGIVLQIYGNLSNSGTASMGAGTAILMGSTAQIVSGVNTFTNLTVNNANGVTITSGEGNSLNISGTLTLALGTLTTNGNLTITSTAAGTGMIDDFSGENQGTISGNLTVQRYVVNPSPSHTTGVEYYYIGSPVIGASVSQWNAEFTNIPINDAGNGSAVIPTASCSDVSLAAGSPYGGLFEYEENTVTSCNLSGWHTIFSGTIPYGQGFAGIIPNGTTLALTGTYNTGTMSSQTLTATSTNETESKGYNLISNPYVSPIHWLGVATANEGINGTAYTYITSGIYAGTYNPVNETTYGLNGLDQIGSSEAVWVEANTNNATVGFTNSVRSNGTNGFLRSAPVWDQLLSLNVSGNGYNDVARIAFGPKFTDGFDRLYDAHKMMGRAVQPNVYVTDSVAKYCIDAIPPLTQNEKDIPVSFTAGTSGQFSFSVDLNGFDPTALVFLEDLQTHVLQNLMVSNTYSFASDVSDDPARFVLHFVPAAVITATAADCIGNDGSVLVDLGKYNVDNTTITWDSYTLKDDNNNVIAVGNNVNGQLTIGNLPGGVYILQLTLGSYVVNEQVVVTSVTSVSAKFATDGNQVQTGAQVQFTNATTGATTYDWSFGDGASSSQLNPTHSYSSAGDYQVLLTATNDSCTGTYSQTITVANVATGINNVSDASATITGYANSVSINFHSFTQLDEVTLNIYDVTGRKIITTQTISTGDSRHVINVDDIASGYYFVVLTGQDYEKAGKVFLTEGN